MNPSNLELKNSLLKIAKKNGVAEIEARISTINEESIVIHAAFLGEFNTGKTTLVNALIGKKILPMFEVPTTAVITEIASGLEDEAFVIKTDENGADTKSQIQFSELASEVTDIGHNKKVSLSLQGIDFLSPGTLLIDTPGIASLNETHDDVTYGYLPTVDVAFLVINPNFGDMPNTMLNFLKKFSPELLEKVYFVVSRSDQIPKEDLELIKTKIHGSLSKFVGKPRILFVSGKEALMAIDNEYADLYSQSGISQLKTIIAADIPSIKTKIEVKRIAQLLASEKQELLQLLKIKLDSLKLDTSELKLQIEQYRIEIVQLEKEIAQFRESFRAIKQQTSTEINNILKEYIGAIGHKLVKDEPYDMLLTGMVNEIKEKIDVSFAQIDKLEIRSIGLTNGIVIADLLKALIDKEISGIKDIANILTDAATFIATVWILPGSSTIAKAGEDAIGAGLVIAQEAGNILSANKSSLGKIVGTVGKMIKELNPFEKIKDAILPYVINPKLTAVLTKKMSNVISNIYDTMGNALNREIENNYLMPLKDKKSVLAETEKLKRERTDEIDSARESVTMDIAFLKSL